MGERPPDDRLDEFQARLDSLKGAHAVRPEGGAQKEERRSGYGMAFGIATELVGGLIGGAIVGWLIDYWLGSAPLGLIVFFLLGAFAGMWNVYRTVRGYDMSLGFGSPAGGGAELQDHKNVPAGARPADESGDQRGQSPPSIPGRADHPPSDRRG